MNAKQNIFFSKENFTIVSQIIIEQLQRKKNVDSEKIQELNTKLFNYMMSTFDKNNDLSLQELNKICIRDILIEFTKQVDLPNMRPSDFTSKEDNRDAITTQFNNLEKERNPVIQSKVGPITFSEDLQENNSDILSKFNLIRESRDQGKEVIKSGTEFSHALRNFDQQTTILNEGIKHNNNPEEELNKFFVSPVMTTESDSAVIKRNVEESKTFLTDLPDNKVLYQPSAQPRSVVSDDFQTLFNKPTSSQQTVINYDKSEEGKSKKYSFSFSSVDKSYDENIYQFRIFLVANTKYKLIPFFENNPTIAVTSEQAELGNRGNINEMFDPNSPIGNLIQFEKIKNIGHAISNINLMNYSKIRIDFVKVSGIEDDVILVSLPQMTLNNIPLVKKENNIYVSMNDIYHDINVDSQSSSLSVLIMDSFGNSPIVKADSGFLKKMYIAENSLVLELHSFFQDDEFAVGDKISISDIEWFNQSWWEYWKTNDTLESPYFLDNDWKEWKYYLERSVGHKIKSVSGGIHNKITIDIPHQLNRLTGKKESNQTIMSQLDNSKIINGRITNLSKQTQLFFTVEENQVTFY
jgi:hypothetical protein